MKFIEQDEGSEKLSSFFWWGYLRRIISLIIYFVITLITVLFTILFITLSKLKMCMILVSLKGDKKLIVYTKKKKEIIDLNIQEIIQEIRSYKNDRKQRSYVQISYLGIYTQV